MVKELSSFENSLASVWLDALRAIAALLVLLEHWRNIFFIDFSAVREHRTVLAPIYALSGLGHQAVIVFFVLSGYLISGTILRSIRKLRWSWKNYLIHRLVRLWVVLIPALVLGLGWDLLGMLLHRAPLLYAGLGGNHVTPDVSIGSSPLVLLGNAAFLQTIFVPPLGSNGALWSLANEWWYYILFPLAACVIFRVYSSWLRSMVCIAGFIAACVLVGTNILALFPAWLCGAALNLLPITRFRFNALIALFAGVLYGCAIAASAIVQHHAGHIGIHIVPVPVADTLLAVATLALLWFVLGNVEQARPSILVGFARLGARFSYSLYVTHTPVLVFCASIALHDERWAPSLGSGLIAIPVLVFVTAYAWAFASATEFKTDSVRKRVESLGSSSA